MSRIAIPSRDDAPAASKPVLDAVHKQLGTIPNLFRLIALSPTTLEGFAAYSGALNKTLDAKTRERIALAVAEVNGCNYCLSAHSYVALNLVKISAEEIALNRKGTSGDAKASAAVRFAAKVAYSRGHVEEAEVTALRSAGYSDAQVVEVVALVALNVFTNFLGNAVKTDIDFPVVSAAE